MATPAQIAFFDSARVTGIMQGLTDPRLLPVPLTWNARIPDVPATDEEISAKYVGQLLIADLVADDAKAVTYSTGRFQFQTVQAVNLKMGIGLNQAMISALNRINQTKGMVRDDVDFFTDRWTKNVADAKFGVELRKEVLKIAMVVDGYSYDRLGIKMNNITWGMYPDLRVTAGTAWASTSATGISDIQTLRSVAQQRYGINYDRATMSTPALRALVAQTEYAAQVKNVYLNTSLGGPTPVVPLQGDNFLKRLAETIIAGTGGAFTIEIDDRRCWSQDVNTAAITSQRLWPISKVALTASGNDGNSGGWDFANCVVAESIVGSMFPGMVIGDIPVGRGPLGYSTPTSPNMNPPGVVTWGVARGFPRKHMNQASAVINVGPLSETFDPSIPAVL